MQERIYEFTHLELSWLFAVAPTASVGQGTPYEAFGWAFLATASLLISAWIGSFSHPSKRITAVMLAFSAGLLISLLSYDLLEVAYETAGLVPALFGFFVGLCLFVLFNRLLQSRGVQRRCSVTHGGLRQESPDDSAQTAGMALVIGALIDGIPEAASIGISLLENRIVSLSVIISVAITNIPEGLASGAGLQRSGWHLKTILLMWGGVVLICSFTSLLSFVFLKDTGPILQGALIALAGGGVLAMTLQTVVPEAFEETHDMVSILGGSGFAIAFVLSRLLPH